MANEATVQGSLQINNTTTGLQYGSRPTSFTATVTGSIGPSPGAISVSIHGTDVSFTQLAQPGLCWLQNLDPTNWVEYGIWDSSTLVFYPLGQLLPGEFNIVRLSPNLLKDEPGTGTGAATGTTTLRLKANAAACVVRVDAFQV